MSESDRGPDAAAPEPAPAGVVPSEPAPAAAPGPVPAPDPVAGAPAAGADLDRRRFFRQFATEMVHTAATVVGAASAIQRSSLEAASSILNPDAVTGYDPNAAQAAAGSPGAIAEPGVGAADERVGGYRSAFRLEGDRIAIVNQRRLPDEIVTIECRTAIDVANEIGDRTIVGGPAIAQVAALGLALSANRVRGSRPYARRAILRAAATSLNAASPSSRHLRAAVERVMSRYLAIGDLDEDGDRIADAMVAEADAILYEALDDHGRLVEAAVGLLPETPDRPLNVLTLGVTGTLGGGQFGTALAVAQAIHHVERAVHVYVAEGRPGLDGARVTAWELAQAGVPHEIVTDAAAGWLLQQRHVDVILVGSAAIALNGDLANDTGTYGMASIATREGVPVIVCSPLAAVDPQAAEGTSLPGEERRALEVLEWNRQRLAAAGESARNPVVDVTPADLITAFATEEGVLRPPFRVALEAARGARARRLPFSLAGAAVIGDSDATPSTPANPGVGAD